LVKDDGLKTLNFFAGAVRKMNPDGGTNELAVEDEASDPADRLV
jgi:hypothetical protein